MKSGKVVRVRINPKDCQSTLDILEKAGVDTSNMSFSSCVALAYSSAIETLKRAHCIEEPDPFQYLNRIQRFEKLPFTSAKKGVADTIYAGQTLGLASPPMPIPGMPSSTHRALTSEEIGKLGVLNDRLNQREQLTPAEQEEYKELERRLYG